MDGLVEVVTLIGIAAIVTTIVAHPASADIVNAMGNAYSNSIRAALGH